MKLTTMALFAMGCLAAGSAAAQTADVRKVDQCVADSAGMNATERVKIMYCTCMVGKMSDSDRRSVTQYETANVAAARDCATRAGWN